MSTWGRLALLAAGAAAGALAARWAGSEQGQRVVGELTQRGATAQGGRTEVEGRAPGRDVPGENRLATRVLRIAQDVKTAMDQREGELRDQLGLAPPQQLRPRSPGIAGLGDDGNAAGRGGPGRGHDDVVDPG
ncbi:hypothetical protein FCK90_04115 [Kocuria coralli]|uniref:Uncharacterized protein n=1 Tax=Kocuria coralli TaxID=1461025 RepID=A0A5J5KZB7_9MICC|nr:hypothetical protein [Kocuria coralli]KAA9395097.1 hypothetical protein FCK90_04115 [Kocuria coralli]